MTAPNSAVRRADGFASGGRGGRVLVWLIGVYWCLVGAFVLLLAAGTVAYQGALWTGVSFRAFTWGLLVCVIGACAGAGLPILRRGLRVLRAEAGRLAERPAAALCFLLLMTVCTLVGGLLEFYVQDDWGHLTRAAFALAHPEQPLSLREIFLAAPYDLEQAYYIPYAHAYVVAAIAQVTSIAPFHLHFNAGGALTLLTFAVGVYAMARALDLSPTAAVGAGVVTFLLCVPDTGRLTPGALLLERTPKLSTLSIFAFPPLCNAALLAWLRTGDRLWWVVLTVLVTAATAAGLNSLFMVPFALACIGLAFCLAQPSIAAARGAFVRLVAAVPTASALLAILAVYLLNVEPSFRDWVDGQAWSWHLARATGVGDLAGLAVSAALGFVLAVRARVQAGRILFWFVAIPWLLVLNPVAFWAISGISDSLEITYNRLFHVVPAPLLAGLALSLAAATWAPRGWTARLPASARSLAGPLCLLGALATSPLGFGSSNLGHPLGATPDMRAELIADARRIGALELPSPVYAYTRIAVASLHFDPSLRFLTLTGPPTRHAGSRLGRPAEARRRVAGRGFLIAGRHARFREPFWRVVRETRPCTLIATRRAADRSDLRARAAKLGYRQVLETGESVVLVHAAPACTRPAGAGPGGAGG